MTPARYTACRDACALSPFVRDTLQTTLLGYGQGLVVLDAWVVSHHLGVHACRGLESRVLLCVQATAPESRVLRCVGGENGGSDTRLRELSSSVRRDVRFASGTRGSICSGGADSGGCNFAPARTRDGLLFPIGIHRNSRLSTQPAYLSRELIQAPKAGRPGWCLHRGPAWLACSLTIFAIEGDVSMSERWELIRFHRKDAPTAARGRGS